MIQYTSKRWKLLETILKNISGKNYQRDALEFRKQFNSKDDWEFVSNRLANIGLLYFLDLGADYQTLHISRQFAEDYYMGRQDKTGLDNEVALLFEPAKCVIGLPVKDMNSLKNVSDSDLWFENLPEADFEMNTRFCNNWEGKPVLFVEETSQSVN